MVFDLPPMVEVAREFIASHGLSERIATVGGDFTADPLPAGADVVIMASNHRVRRLHGGRRLHRRHRPGVHPGRPHPRHRHQARLMPRAGGGACGCSARREPCPGMAHGRSTGSPGGVDTSGSSGRRSPARRGRTATRVRT
ncbi:MAG: hypothetical protein HYY95_24185 [Candidatus Rokubacteria bacterium]|nr:hypothetical protein [Candidatus Rokubacteria bacterium]